MRALVVALLALSCTRHLPPSEPLVVYEAVYVANPPVERLVFVYSHPGARLPTPLPPPDHGYVVAEPRPHHRPHQRERQASYGSPPPTFYAPTPRTAVAVVRDLPASQRKHTKWHYDKAVTRCDAKATKWARNRCYAKAAR